MSDASSALDASAADATVEVTHGDYVVSTDHARIDVAAVHGFLSQSYWSPGIPEDTLRRAIAGAICFGVYRGTEQVGFARVITDRATYAYLADVYVLPPYRGRGLSKWMMEAALAHPELQGLRRWQLVTKDAQGLYARFGFTPVAHPERHMERTDRGVYARRSEKE